MSDMRDENDPCIIRLVAAHPRMFRGQQPAVSSHVPEGWYPLVDKLCGGIGATLRGTAKPWQRTLLRHLAVDDREIQILRVTVSHDRRDLQACRAGGARSGCINWAPSVAGIGVETP